jgi:hypothetical protein
MKFTKLYNAQYLRDLPRGSAESIAFPLQAGNTGKDIRNNSTRRRKFGTKKIVGVQL